MIRNLPVALSMFASLVCVSNTCAQAAYNPEARLAELKLTLPALEAPIGNYVRVVRTGNLLFLAGHGEGTDNFLTAKVGGGVTTEQAYASAKRTGLPVGDSQG
jgi:hypothetical protein